MSEKIKINFKKVKLEKKKNNEFSNFKKAIFKECFPSPRFYLKDEQHIWGKIFLVDKEIKIKLRTMEKYHEKVRYSDSINLFFTVIYEVIDIEARQNKNLDEIWDVFLTPKKIKINKAVQGLKDWYDSNYF